MKKSKILIFAALAAAAVAISSCSDNDVLDSTTKAKGNALIVNASLNDGSRIATTGSDGFNSFMLYGYTNPTSGTPTSLFDVTGDGIAYQKTSGTWGLVDANLASKAVWPSSSGGTYNFYALSVGGSHELDASTNGLGLSTIKNGIFTYTMPKNNDGTVNLAAQKDILVACNNGATKGESGVLTLPFKHALAKVILRLRFNKTEYVLNSNGSLKSNTAEATSSSINQATPAVAYIDYIAIHNVACSGSYDFKDANGTWTVDAEKSTIKYQFDSPKEFYAGTATTEDKDNGVYWHTQDLLGGETGENITDNTIMMLPQEITAWDPTSSHATDEAVKAYIEIRCISYGLTNDAAYNTAHPTFMDDQENGAQLYPSYIVSDDVNTVDGYESVYIPLKVSEFEANKSYVLNLNLVTSKDNNGANAFEGAKILAQ